MGAQLLSAKTLLWVQGCLPGSSPCREGFIFLGGLSLGAISTASEILTHRISHIHSHWPALGLHEKQPQPTSTAYYVRAAPILPLGLPLSSLSKASSGSVHPSEPRLECARFLAALPSDPTLPTQDCPSTSPHFPRNAWASSTAGPGAKGTYPQGFWTEKSLAGLARGAAPGLSCPEPASAWGYRCHLACHPLLNRGWASILSSVTIYSCC